MDADPFWEPGSSGHPPLPDKAMSPSQMFWSQFWELVMTYGAAFVITAFLGGGVFGFALHFFQNVLPQKLAKRAEADRKRHEEELRKTETEEFAKIKSGDSVFRGKMNSKMIAALCKSVNLPENPQEDSQETMSDIRNEREALLTEKEEKSDLSEEESDTFGELPLKHQDEKQPLLEDDKEKPDLIPDDEKKEVDQKNVEIKKLGTLHGKLATAQLRARTRRMEMEMTPAERNTEAEMRARQLESIMKLMMQNQDKFGMNSDDVKEQLNLYNF